jgi:hypothetical protein
MNRFIIVIYSAHWGTACKNGKNVCSRYECVMHKKSRKGLLQLGYKVRSLGASRFCIVVVDIHEECATAHEKRREHKRREQNGTERRGREMNIRGGQRREQKSREEKRREEDRKSNKKKRRECNGTRGAG